MGAGRRAGGALFVLQYYLRSMQVQVYDCSRGRPMGRERVYVRWHAEYLNRIATGDARALARSRTTHTTQGAQSTQSEHRQTVRGAAAARAGVAQYSTSQYSTQTSETRQIPYDTARYVYSRPTSSLIRRSP